ncbi:four-helix bundle copper-binding protein [Streptomyces sp. enrichment culture]
MPTAEQERTQDHFRVCAEACRRCEQACNELLAGLG